MLLSTVVGALAGVLSFVHAAQSPRAASNRIIGYHQSWYFYDNNNIPFQLSADAASRYTHINYAFATIHYHTKTDQFYIGFTDSYADYQACVGTSCPTECIPVPANKQCTGGKVAMVPFIGATGTCPDKACYNPSGVPGSPRVPQCEAVLDVNGIQTDANGSPVICGNYAYVLSKMKKQSPGLKFLISVGGWYDSNLFSAATEPQYIDKFVTSVVKFVEFFGFDGVDFDWEYPGWEHGNQAPFKGAAAGTGTAEDMTDCDKATCAYPGRKNDMAKFNALVTKVRAGLKTLGKTPAGADYLISMAAPAGYDKMNKLDVYSICQQLDFINIMTYDIHGEWETNTNHQAPLYDNTPPQYQYTNGVPQTSVDFAVNYWLNFGCPASQIVVGVPFYAHAWKAADNGTHGLYQPGTTSPITKLNYVNLAADSSITTYWDAASQASYGYSTSQGTFYSFDTAQAISTKVGYGAQKGLGGFMVWPIDGDDSNNTLLKALTGPGIVPPPPPSSTTGSTKTTATAKTTSTIAATDSTSTTANSETTSATTTAKTAVTTVASDCFPLWSAVSPYNGGAKVSYNNVNYVANWWSGSTDIPGKSDSWKAVGPCGSGQTSATVVTTTAGTTTTTTTTTKAASTTTKSTTAATTNKPTTSTTTTTTTKISTATSTAASGPVVGQSCSSGISQCSAGTMYYCLGSKWIVWYIGCEVSQ